MHERKPFIEKVRQVCFLLVLTWLGCLIVRELRYFVSAILGGFTLYIILRRPQCYLLSKGWSNSLTTVVLLIVTFIFLMLIISGLLSLLYDNLKYFHPQFILDGLHHIHDLIIKRWGYNIFSQDITTKVLSSLGNIIPKVLSATGNIVANIVIMLFVLFFMLYQRVQFERNIENMIPLSRDSIFLLRRSVRNMIISNAVGLPLIMFGQALTAGLAYWLLKIGDPVMWGFMTCFFGLIPVVGTAGIWVPLSLELFLSGQILKCIILLIYGAVVIASVDNIVRIILLRKTANVHPLITLFGVILGINLFGFWGIIFGPLLISSFFLLIRIYKNEFRKRNISDINF